jgi:hypothetical protein
VSVPGSRYRVTTRAARPADLPAVLTLVRQHRTEAHAEGVLTGQTPGAAAAAGCSPTRRTAWCSPCCPARTPRTAVQAAER